MNAIKLFKKCINKSIYNITKDINTRKTNTVQFKDIVYYSSYLVGNNVSYDLTNSHLKIHKILDVSKKTLIIEEVKLIMNISKY